MNKPNIQTTKHVVPMLYGYSTPEVVRHNGWTKIGYTEQDVETRINQQTHTADVKWQLEWKGNATFDDGSGETFIDKDFHAYLRKSGIEQENGKNNEWFHVDGTTSKQMFRDFREDHGIIKVGLRMKGKSKKQKSRNTKKQKYIKLAITLSIVIVIILFCNFQNKHLETTHYTYAAEQLGADLEGYRIVQISDLHNAKFGKNNQKLVGRIRECEPDMIVLTGDLVDSNHTNVDRAVQFVDEIVKICPVYYVTGNHEYWLEKSEYDELMDGLIGAGVVILDDQVVEISRGDAKFRLVGLDDKSLADGTLGTLLNNAQNVAHEDSEKKEFTVVLAHEPQYLARYASSGVDLVLSGHAHGGQFRLPFVGGIVAPDQGFFPEYTAGEYYMDGTEMIVSRGLGNSVIPVRLFNYPEIVCVELVGKH